MLKCCQQHTSALFAIAVPFAPAKSVLSLAPTAEALQRSFVLLLLLLLHLLLPFARSFALLAKKINIKILVFAHFSHTLHTFPAIFQGKLHRLL